MEQLYIDRFASIHEQLAYKKSQNASTYRVMTDMFSGVMHLGHDPFFVCIYANKIILKNDQLKFFYKIAVDTKDKFNPVFEDRTQTISTNDKGL